MIASLAASFRALFPLIAAIAALTVVGAAAVVWLAGYGLPATLGLLVGGLIALVALFGLVAIQIDNNELLAFIAEAVTDPRSAMQVPSGAGAETAAAGAMTPHQRSAAALARAVVGREPVPASAAGSGSSHVSAPPPGMEGRPEMRPEMRPEPRPAPAPHAQPRLTVPSAPQAVRPLAATHHAAPMAVAAHPGPAQTWGRAEPVLTARRG